MVKDSQLFNPDDFESIEVRVYIQNITVDKVIREPDKTSILELGDKALTLGLPRWACEVGNHLMVNIFRVERGTRNEVLFFSTTSKVESLIDAGDGMATANIGLLQYDKKGWAELNALFNKRQEEISRFLENGKK